MSQNNRVYCKIIATDQQLLSVDKAIGFVEDPSHGAVDMFIGKVREVNLGRDVVGISYDVFIELAEKTFNDIAKQAIEQWGDDLKIYIVHAQGRLAVSEASVIIAVGSKHRDESFKACRFIIEAIKHRSPIWKQEHYIDGDSDWVKGHALCQRCESAIAELECAHQH